MGLMKRAEWREKKGEQNEESVIFESLFFLPLRRSKPLVMLADDVSMAFGVYLYRGETMMRGLWRGRFGFCLISLIWMISY